MISPVKLAGEPCRQHAPRRDVTASQPTPPETGPTSPVFLLPLNGEPRGLASDGLSLAFGNFEQAGQV